MKEHDTTLTVEDRLAIHELMALHGHLVDDGAIDDLGSLFTEDAVYDVSALGFGSHRGLDRLRELFQYKGEGNPVGHHVTNVLVRIERVGGGPEVARAQWIASRRGPDPPCWHKIGRFQGEVAQDCATPSVIWLKFAPESGPQSASEGSGPRCVAMHCGCAGGGPPSLGTRSS